MMDPNAALQTLKEWATKAAVAGSYDETEWAAVEAFDALDDWLSAGGFLPEAWQRKSTPVLVIDSTDGE